MVTVAPMISLRNPDGSCVELSVPFSILCRDGGELGSRRVGREVGGGLFGELGGLRWVVPVKLWLLGKLELQEPHHRKVAPLLRTASVRLYALKGPVTI